MTNEERIKADAQAYSKSQDWNERSKYPVQAAFYDHISSICYIAGATAEHAQNESVRLQLEAQNANVEILLSQKKELIDKAQMLVDALEWIKTYGPVDELTVRFIDKALEQWKEVGDA